MRPRPRLARAEPLVGRAKTVQGGNAIADETPMRTPRVVALSLAAASFVVLVIWGCSGGSGGAPAPLPTGPGDTTSTGGPPVGSVFDFRFPGTGISHAYTFTQAGDWRYLCLKHGVDGMRGTVFVRESSLRDSALVHVGQGGNKVYFPDTVTVRVNGVVRWTNVSSDLEHTATSH